MGRKRQFSLKQLLMLMLVCSFAVIGWMKFVYVHPAHKFPFYERAAYSRNGRMKFGRTKISLRSVGRIDRDGIVTVEDGFGRALKSAALPSQIPPASAHWLDSAEIDLHVEGGDIEVIDTRVFDYETRLTVDSGYRFSGHRMVDSKRMQIYRLGEKLPDRVDVLLHIHVFDKASKVSMLPPVVGAKCKLPRGELEVTEIVRGATGYRANVGVDTDPQLVASNFALMLRFKGRSSGSKGFHFVVVRKDGTRDHSNRHWISFPDTVPEGFSLMHVFNVNLDDVARIELRPAGREFRFFFEGVHLPKTSGAAFESPPSPQVKLTGGVALCPVPDLAPLRVNIATMEGDAIGGVVPYDVRSGITLNPLGTKTAATQCTVSCRIEGLSYNPWEPIPLPSGAMVSGSTTPYNGRVAAHCLMNVALEKVDAVLLKFKP